MWHFWSCRRAMLKAVCATSKSHYFQTSFRHFWRAQPSFILTSSQILPYKFSKTDLFLFLSQSKSIFPWATWWFNLSVKPLFSSTFQYYFRKFFPCFPSRISICLNWSCMCFSSYRLLNAVRHFGFEGLHYSLSLIPNDSSTLLDSHEMLALSSRRRSCNFSNWILFLNNFNSNDF
jgi:hypothetical protein